MKLRGLNDPLLITSDGAPAFVSHSRKFRANSMADEILALLLKREHVAEGDAKRRARGPARLEIGQELR